MDLICDAPECGHPATQLLPNPQEREESLARLIAAPLSCFCLAHAIDVSDRYARAVAQALSAQYNQGVPVWLGQVQALCDQLHQMPTHTAQATHAVLTRLQGIE